MPLNQAFLSLIVLGRNSRNFGADLDLVPTLSTNLATGVIRHALIPTSSLHRCSGSAAIRCCAQPRLECLRNGPENRLSRYAIVCPANVFLTAFHPRPSFRAARYATHTRFLTGSVLLPLRRRSPFHLSAQPLSNCCRMLSSRPYSTLFLSSSLIWGSSSCGYRFPAARFSLSSLTGGAHAPHSPPAPSTSRASTWPSSRHTPLETPSHWVAAWVPARTVLTVQISCVLPLSIYSPRDPPPTCCLAPQSVPLEPQPRTTLCAPQPTVHLLLVLLTHRYPHSKIQIILHRPRRTVPLQLVDRAFQSHAFLHSLPRLDQRLLKPPNRPTRRQASPRPDQPAVLPRCTHRHHLVYLLKQNVSFRARIS